MKSIALISEHASPLAALGGVDSGGQNVYVAQLAEHLAARGVPVDVFTRRDSDALPEIIDFKDRVRIVNVTAGPFRYVRKEDLLPNMEEFSENMIQFCARERRYDIIHANFWMSGLVAARIKRRLEIPFVITFHALGRIRRRYQREADTFPGARFDIEDLIVRECDGIVAECPQDREDLIELYRAKTDKITVIPCGFDPRELWPVGRTTARSMLEFPLHRLLVLQLGRIVPRKGIDNVIRGFARFVREQRSDASLIIVGGATRVPDPNKDPEIGRLQQVARQEGVADRVIFRGQAGRDELKYYYSAADVFVTTPWYEPFGITPLESMACGTPVIGSDVGGIKFSVKDGETGFLIPPNDPVALAKRLNRVFRFPEALNIMGKKAIERANRMFAWEVITQRMLGFYRSVLKKYLRDSKRIGHEAREPSFSAPDGTRQQ